MPHRANKTKKASANTSQLSAGSGKNLNSSQLSASSSATSPMTKAAHENVSDMVSIIDFKAWVQQIKEQFQADEDERARLGKDIIAAKSAYDLTTDALWKEVKFLRDEVKQLRSEAHAQDVTLGGQISTARQLAEDADTRSKNLRDIIDRQGDDYDMLNKMVEEFKGVKSSEYTECNHKIKDMKDDLKRHKEQSELDARRLKSLELTVYDVEERVRKSKVDIDYLLHEDNKGAKVTEANKMYECADRRYSEAGWRPDRGVRRASMTGPAHIVEGHPGHKSLHGEQVRTSSPYEPDQYEEYLEAIRKHEDTRRGPTAREGVSAERPQTQREEGWYRYNSVNDGRHDRMNARRRDPPEYCGQGDFETKFKFQFELVADHNFWSEQERLFHLSGSLKGEALEYFYNLPNDVRNNYQAAMARLASVFTVKEKVSAVRLEVSGLRQNVEEPLEDFVKRTRMLVSSAYRDCSIEMVNHMSMEAFRRGVKDRAALNTALNRNPTNLDEMYQYMLEATHNSKVAFGGKPGIRELSQQWDESEAKKQKRVVFKDREDLLDRLQELLEKLGTDHKQGEGRRRSSSPSPSRRGSQNGMKCHRCRSPEHLIRDCPEPQVCFYCKEEGHVRSECPTAIQEENNQENC